MIDFVIEDKKYTANARQYRGLAYNTNINRDTRRFYKKYKKKIGYQLGATVESMLMRRGQLILMLANAGGGKTYCILQQMAKLSMVEANSNVRYVIAVPNRNQSNQNEKSDSLSRFKAKSIVGSQDGKRKIEVNTITNQIFSCVYDKALEVVEILKSNGHEVVLVLDECHKLIADNNFRGNAISNLEKAFSIADQTIMMTATPRRCLQYYKYDEIYHLIDEDANSNIEDFRIVLSETVKYTLFKEIKKLLSNKATVVEEQEVWEDTLEVIPPATLLEMLEGTKYQEVKKKTATLITSKEVDAKVLVRLNSIKEIDKYIALLEKAGIKAEKLTRKEKDGEVFKSIEEQSKIISESRVIFCTSVVECGVSLENQDIYLVEMLRSAKDFDMDNTIQFFNRARKTIGQGVIIAPDYINKDGRARAKANAKANNLDKYEYKRVDFSGTSNRITDAAKLKAMEVKFDILRDKFIEETHEIANIDYMTMKNKLDIYKNRRGEEYARIAILDEIENAKINNPFFSNTIHVDTENLAVYVDDKVVIDKAFKEMDKYILRARPKMLLEYFEDKIFYNTITIEHCNIVEEIESDEAVAKQYKDMTKFMSEMSKEQSEIKAMKTDRARELMKDDEFTKLLDDIVENNIYKENIKEYTEKYTIKDVLSFKETSIYTDYKKLSKLFSKEEAVIILNTQIIKTKALENRYKKAKKIDGNLKYKYFKDNINIVPAPDELRYLKSTEINHIIEAKHFMNTSNNVGFYKAGLHDKHSTILDVVLPAKTNKNGKLVSIRASKELLFKLNVEMVFRKVYKDAKIEKVINAIKKDAQKHNTKIDLYSSANIKKLEAAYSSEKNDIKMLIEISKVFSVVADCEGYYKINSIQKTFDIFNILNQLN